MHSSSDTEGRSASLHSFIQKTKVQERDWFHLILLHSRRVKGSHPHCPSMEAFNLPSLGQTAFLQPLVNCDSSLLTVAVAQFPRAFSVFLGSRSGFCDGRSDTLTLLSQTISPPFRKNALVRCPRPGLGWRTWDGASRFPHFFPNSELDRFVLRQHPPQPSPPQPNTSTFLFYSWGGGLCSRACTEKL